MNSSQGMRGFITFLILLAILITGVVGFNYISTPTNTSSEAGESKLAPLNVSVNNITDSTADITWTTVDPSTSKLIYSKNLNATCLSATENISADCQSFDETEPQTSHTVKLTNLDGETTYFFRILTNGKFYPSDANHTFRTNKKIPEPIKQEPPIEATPSESDFNGFEGVTVPNPNKVLGASDTKDFPEPIDPLANIANMVQAEFKEALTYNDMRYDFNKDGKVTMADYPLFINFVMNYSE